VRLFESFYRDPDKSWVFYERFWDGKESRIQQISTPSEMFIQDRNGEFKYLLDKSISLKKVKQDYKVTDCYGINDAGHAHIRDNYWDLENPKYNRNPRVWYLDIETTAHWPVDTQNCYERIVSIQIYDNLLNMNIIFGEYDFIEGLDYQTENGFYKFDKVYDFKLKYLKCNTEAELLNNFFKLIRVLKPLIVYAHNGEGFDFAYLWKRTEKLGLTEGFSPFGRSEFRESKLPNGNDNYKIEAPGVFYTDFLNAYKKIVLAPRDSYALDALAELEIGEHKVNHECFKTFDGFRTGEGYIRPQEEPAKSSIFEYILWHAKTDDDIKRYSKRWFVHYSIIDTFLLYRIDKKIKITNIIVSMSAMMGCLFKESLGTIQAWGNFIRNYCYSKKLILPNPQKEVEAESVKGGYVKEPLPNIYEWGFSLDVNSMYPSQIIAFNMSPETYVPISKLPMDLQMAIQKLGLSIDDDYFIDEYFKNPHLFDEYSQLLNKYNLCGSMNGVHFRKDEKGIIPILVEMIFNNRKNQKKEMLEHKKTAEMLKDEIKRRHLNV